MADNRNSGFEVIGDGFKSVFLAGLGALSLGAEKGKELVDAMVKQGEISFEQGKEINSELQRKAAAVAETARDTALEARMKAMSPDERDAFAAKVAELAKRQNAETEEVVAEVEAVVEEADPAPSADKGDSDAGPDGATGEADRAGQA